MKSKYHTNQQAGQIGLIILLIMVVLLTAGLSLAARTTQELFLAQQSAESARVFNAAEAGIEQALNTSFNFEGEVDTGSIQDITDTTVDYSVTKKYVLETLLFEGVSVSVDTTGVQNGQGLVVQWARESSCADNPASLLASIYNVDPNTNLTTVRYRTLGNCARGDSFEQASTLGSGPLRYEFTLDLEENDVFVRLKPLYNDTNVLVAGADDWDLPVQYFNIRSQANNTTGDETRIVEVNRTLPTAPSILDYALYSGDTLVK